MRTAGPSEDGGARRSHLTNDELERWLALGRERERERVEGHLSSCDSCGNRYRELLESEWLPPPRRLEVERFVRRGLAVPATASIRPARRRAFLWASVGAALAASLLLVTFLPGVFRHEPAPEVFRGNGPRALKPVGRVERAPVFEWSATSDSVLVEIFDASRSRIYSARRRGGSMEVESDLAALLTPGKSYYWMVTRLDSRGARLDGSAMVEFRLSER